MTDTQKLKRLYMLLRWYDRCVELGKIKKEEIAEEDLRLAYSLELEMHELQRKINSAAKKRKKKK
jgi:hypothetical protein